MAGNRLVPSDAMRAIDRLLLDGWIPPGIENDDGGGSRQIQSDPARLQADQENVGRATLDCFTNAGRLTRLRHRDETDSSA